MNRQLLRSGSTLALLTVSAAPAFAHHLMGGRTPATFGEGILSGLGHPIIGLDHFAAVVAVGCIAAAHRVGPALVVGFILAMMAGVALHLQGASVPAAEIMVAFTVIALGAVMLRGQNLAIGAGLTLFALVGLVHGYALGESIYGAEPTPLYAYLLGLAVVQSAIALAAMGIARSIARRSTDVSPVRLVGAGIAGIGLAVLMQQVIPAA
ncbi:MAG TPA: HupE/UreJ family protein [Pseudolabrys sp.]|jgi:urease accessory protein|nr:HupE/UreJ family protein [Pseudolabrys sp.]